MGKLYPFHEEVCCLSGTVTTGCTRREDAIEDAADKPHPPSHKDERKEPNHSKTDLLGLSHLHNRAT